MVVPMPRWDPRAKDRLRDAALDLRVCPVDPGGGSAAARRVSQITPGHVACGIVVPTEIVIVDRYLVENEVTIHDPVAAHAEGQVRWSGEADGAGGARPLT
jgi:hypothetical protein